MWTQLFKAPRTDKRRYRRESPKVRRLMNVLPEPFVIDETLSVPFN